MPSPEQNPGHATDDSDTARPKRIGPMRIGMVSLGCPKALVDSERILTRLRSEGYETSPTYEGSDAIVVNTCAFIDSAREESLDAIAEAEASGRPVIVTGCMGGEETMLRERFPTLAAVTGAHRYDAVMDAIHSAVPPDPFAELAPVTAAGVRLTPKHYAYLKISEGCDHRCAFCIIPSLRGDLASRPIGEVMAEAEALVESGVKELLVVAQDTSAYGLDLRYASGHWRGQAWRANLEDLCRALGELGVWVRLHYVYPYPHVDAVIPLMAEGKILPYLDIPLQHAAPGVLRAMRRPANEAKTLDRIRQWRETCPDITLRSTFVVGFPGETEADFEYLLEWLEEAELDRVGCFAYENVQGAAAQALAGHVPEDVKQARRERFMSVAARISRARLRRKVGRTLQVLVDEVRGDGLAVARSMGDAPEIDGKVFVRPGHALRVGEFVSVKAQRADSFDLLATPTDFRLRNAQPLAISPSRRMHPLISRL
jgi:ribosomal protein S12 methylthiotransferase